MYILFHSYKALFETSAYVEAKPRAFQTMPMEGGESRLYALPLDTRANKSAYPRAQKPTCASERGGEEINHP
jgi:hypothetical protein